jgi:tripartite-type tricarboxylate transporter receptor subunit TctC
MRTRQADEKARRVVRIDAMLVGLSLALGAQLAPQPGQAQYPARPVRLVVGLAPGGGPDIAARIIAGKLPALLGQAVIVENRVGSAGNIATEYVARSAPDGYVLLMSNDSMMAINPHIYANMTVDVLKDLAPVAQVCQTSNFFLTVHPSVPAKNFQEFIEYARKANPPLAYASVGHGSQHHMAMEMLKARAGINLLHVPYKGGAPAATATVAGEVAVMIGGASTVNIITSGKLRGLAGTGRSRSPLFPDLPVIGEFYPGYELSTWIGIFSAVGVSDAAGSRLRGELGKVLAMPEVAKGLNAAGLEPHMGTREEFSERIRSDYEKYGKLVKLVGAKVDD